MPGYVNGIPHATSTDRIDLWPTTSRNLAQWIDGNMLRDDDPRLTNARPPTTHTHPISDVTGLAARLAALEYKTGRRIITSLLREGVTGLAMVSRTADLVVLNLYGILPPEPVGSTIVDVFAPGLPVGFRPDASLSVPLSVTTATAPAFIPRVFINAVGVCRVNTPGSPLFGVVTYRTNDAPPATLPGDPA